MQLHFAPEELSLLADILLNQRDPIGVLDRVMARDLRLDSDELDQLRDALIANQKRTRADLADTKNPQRTKGLLARQILLESMVEKVSEACAML